MDEMEGEPPEFFKLSRGAEVWGGSAEKKRSEEGRAVVSGAGLNSGFGMGAQLGAENGIEGSPSSGGEWRRLSLFTCQRYVPSAIASRAFIVWGKERWELERTPQMEIPQTWPISPFYLSS